MVHVLWSFGRKSTMLSLPSTNICLSVFNFKTTELQQMNPIDKEGKLNLRLWRLSHKTTFAVNDVKWGRKSTDVYKCARRYWRVPICSVKCVYRFSVVLSPWWIVDFNSWKIIINIYTHRGFADNLLRNKIKNIQWRTYN